MSDEILEKLKARRGLPTPPGVALRLMDQMRSGTSTVGEVAATLGCDPALTARMLAYANSPLVGAANEVASLERAVTLLGMRRVGVLALSYCFVDMSSEVECDGFDREAFWQESLARAVIVRHLVRHVAPHEADQAFLMGVVSGMGRLALATGMPQEYGHVLRQGRSREDVRRLEKERLGSTSEEVGIALLRQWSFPPSVIECVLEGQALCSGLSPLSEHALPRCLCLAQLVAETIVGTTFELGRIERIYALASEILSLSSQEWDEMFAECVEQWKTQCEVFDVSSHDVKSFAQIEAEAREELAMLSIAAVSESEQMFERATTDELTRIPNRASFNSRLELEVERFRRSGDELLLIMIDIDHFKSFNDRFGHQLGDEVLRKVARRLDGSIRKVDFCARYGGEEFAVIAPQCARDHVTTVTERLRKAVESIELEHEDTQLAVTISLGCAYARMGVCTETVMHDLIARADQQLYAAKDAGRNRACIEGTRDGGEPHRARPSTLRSPLAGR